MKILGLDHVAICSPSIDEAAAPFLVQLGLAQGPRELVESQRTLASFLLSGDQAGACIELIAPAGNPTLEKFLARRGAGLHHVAFRVDDLAAALDELAARGTPLIDRVPRPGARGHRVAFLHPGACGGVLVELVEAHEP